MLPTSSPTTGLRFWFPHQRSCACVLSRLPLGTKPRRREIPGGKKCNNTCLGRLIFGNSNLYCDQPLRTPPSPQVSTAKEIRHVAGRRAFAHKPAHCDPWQRAHQIFGWLLRKLHREALVAASLSLRLECVEEPHTQREVEQTGSACQVPV